MKPHHAKPKFPFRDVLHLGVLSAFAISQPLFSKISENVPFLLAHHATRVDLLCFAAILTLAPWILSGLLPALAAAFSRALAQWVASAVFALLGALLLLPALRGFGALWGPTLLALSGGALLAWLYRRSHTMQTLAGYLSPAIVIFPLYFLFFSPVQALWVSAERATGAQTPGRHDVNVVVMMLDEFPLLSLLDGNGDIDPVHYPHFAALAAGADWYRHATTDSGSTVMAVPSILTGLIPHGQNRRLPLASRYPENLFTLLAPGRQVFAIENGTQMCPRSICGALTNARSGPVLRAMLADSAVIFGHITLPRALAAKLPGLGARWSGFAAVTPPADGGEPTVSQLHHAMRWGARRREFNTFLRTLGTLGDGSVYYLHSLLPHAPWVFLPDGRRYAQNSAYIDGVMPDDAPERTLKHQWYDDDWAVLLSWQRHLLQVGFVDRMLGQVVDRLRATGIYDHTLLIVVGDHGVAFRPGLSRREPDLRTLAEIAPVPLLVKYPGQTRGRRVDSFVSHPDILPTVLEVLGLPAPSGLDGKPLRQHSANEAFNGRMIRDTNVEVRFSKRQYQAALSLALATKLRSFSDPGGGRPRGTPHAAALLGASDRAFQHAPPPAGGARLERPGAWTRVDPQSPNPPLLLGGAIDGAQPPGHALELAFSLDRTIVATAASYTFPGGEGRFGVLLPAAALHAGFNRLDVYQVLDQGKSLQLAPLFSNTQPSPTGGEPTTRLSPTASGAQPIPAARATAINSARSTEGWHKTLLPGADGFDESLLRGDWYGPGDGIRWMGRRAGLVLPAAPAGPSLATIELIPFLVPRKLHAQRLLLRFNGHTVSQSTLTQRRLYTLKIRLPAQPMGEPWRLELETPDAAVPAELGVGADERLLGVAVQSIRITPLPSPR